MAAVLVVAEPLLSVLSFVFIFSLLALLLVARPPALIEALIDEVVVVPATDSMEQKDIR